MRAHLQHARRRGWALTPWLLSGLMSLAGAREAGAHQDPVGCSGAGLALLIHTFLADGVTGAPSGTTVSECETLIDQGEIGFPGGGVCSIQGGQLTITTPDGITHDANPVGGVAKLGGTGGISSLVSLPITYHVRPVDVANGQIGAVLSYTLGISHTGPGSGDTIGFPTGTSFVLHAVAFCAAAGVCASSFCNPTSSDGVRLGLCEAASLPNGTACDRGKSCVCQNGQCVGGGGRRRRICRP